MNENRRVDAKIGVIIISGGLFSLFVNLPPGPWYVVAAFMVFGIFMTYRNI